MDLDILWETPARMETAEIQATRNPDMPAVPCLSTPGWPAKRESSRTCGVTWCDVGIDRKQVVFMGYWRQGKAEGWRLPPGRWEAARRSRHPCGPSPPAPAPDSADDLPPRLRLLTHILRNYQRQQMSRDGA